MRVVVLLTGLMVLGAFAGCFGSGDPEKPVAKFTYQALEEPDSFLFDASKSAGESLTYRWDFGDGTNTTDLAGEAKPEHTYDFSNGVYTVKLCVVDSDGEEACDTEDVTVGNGINQLPEAHFTRSLPRAAVGETIRFDASESLDRDSDPITYKWDFNYLIEIPDYNAFREAANGGDEHAGHAGHGGGNDSGTGPQSTGFRPPQPQVPQVPVPVRPSGGDHGPSGPERNWDFQATETTSAAIVNQSYPAAGLYIVRLQVVDIKGGVGEDYWPILVEESPPARSWGFDDDGTVLLGGGDQDIPAAGETDPNENVTSTTLDFPTFAFFVNLTWDAGAPVGSSSQNQLRLIVTFSDGTTFNVSDGTGESLDGVASIEGWLTPLPAGEVEFRIIAASGANIAWTLDAYATLNTDPFHDGLVEEGGGGH